MAHTKALVAYYHCTMLKNQLIQTNPYLRAPEQYRKALAANASSSTAIETGATAANLTVVRPLLTLGRLFQQGIEAMRDVYRDAFGTRGVGERSGSRRLFARGV